MLKRSIGIALIISLVVSLFVDTGKQVLAQAQELLSNPGFEENDYYPWYGQSADLTIDTNFVNSNTNSMRVYNRQESYGSTAQSVIGALQMNGSGSYTYSGYFRLEEGETPINASLVLRIDDADGPHWFVSDLTEISDEGFTELTATWDLSWKGSLTGATVYFDTPGNTSDLYVDDFSFKNNSNVNPDIELDGPELLNNPGFEEGLTDWQTQDAQIQEELIEVHSGLQAIKTHGRSQAWGSPIQNITDQLLSNGRGQYTFSGFAKTAEESTYAFIVVRVRGDKDSTDKWFTSAPQLLNADGYTKLSGTEVISWNGKLKSAHIYIQTQGDQLLDMYMDDLSLKKSEVDLAVGQTYSASGSSGIYTPEKAFDGDRDTRWESDRSNGESWLDVDFGKSITFSKAIFRTYGSGTQSYKIEYWDGANWQTAYAGDIPGNNNNPIEVYFPYVTGSKARLYFDSIQSAPSITEFSIYKFDGSVPDTIPIQPIATPEPDPNLWQDKPIVGAIRWDAWTGIGPGEEVEKSLGPEKYHDRLPFYANIIDENTVEIIGSTQAVIDQEILYAKDAGINYWAFNWYSSDYHNLHLARELYLSSEYRNEINWTVILGSFFNYDTDLPWLIERFKETNFQKVLDGRPLLYMFDVQGTETALINRIRTETVAAGVPTPYIVALGWDSSIAVKASEVGADAISSYVVGATHGVPYSTLTDMEKQRWDDYKTTGKQVIPSVTTGWDKRPRHDNPVSWEPQSSLTEWTERPTPEQIADHLQEAINWNAANRDSAIANTILMYAWNENDEGGWLSPTLFELRDYGKPLRLEAIKKVLKPEEENITHHPVTPPIMMPSEPVILQGMIRLAPLINHATGIASSILSSADVSRAFDQVNLDIKGNQTIIIEMPEVADAKQYLLQIPAEILSTANKNRKILIKTPSGNILIAENMFKPGQVTGAKEIGIAINNVDPLSLPEKVKNEVGNRPVIDISITVDGKVVDWNNPDSPVTVAIDYKPSTEELKDWQHITVRYLSDDGNVIAVPNGKYDSADGQVKFTTTHFSKYAIMFVQKKFNDISKSWAQKSIEVLASKGLFDSVNSDSNFLPKSNLTRAEFINLLIKSLGLSIDFTANFKDMKPEHEFYHSVGMARALGIAAGAAENKFNPDTDLTRQDMIVFAARTLAASNKIIVSKDESNLEKFLDGHEVSRYAAASVSALIREGIIKGSGNRLKPLALTTKEEVASLLWTLYNL